MKSNSQSIRVITYSAMYCALIMVMSLVPFTGFILIIPGFKITTIGLIVVIATWHLKLPGAIVASLSFGLGSFISGAIYPSLLGAFFYEHPWIAFVPRIFMGILLFISIKLMGKFNNVKFIFSIVIGALYNTAFVLSAILIIGKGKFIGLIILANVGVEAIVIPLLSLPLAKFVNKTIIDYEKLKKISW